MRLPLTLALLLAVPVANGESIDVTKPIPEVRLGSGVVLQNVKIIGYAESALMARWEDGRGTILYDDLPPAVLEAVEQYRPKKRETPPPRAATQAPEGQLSIGKIALRAVEEAGDYTYYAWTAEIRNLTKQRRSVRTKISLFDKKRFLLEDSYSDSEIIPAGDQETISGKSLVTTAIYSQVASYSVQILD